MEFWRRVLLRERVYREFVTNFLSVLVTGRTGFCGNLVKNIIELAAANLDVTFEEPQLGDVRHSFANIEKTRRDLGTRGTPRDISFESRIKEGLCICVGARW